MITNVKPEDKKEFNRLAYHPLQSWEWGEFRQKTGIEIIRLGKYQKDKLTETAQVSIHQIPFTSWTIGYLPKSKIPSSEMLEKLSDVGRKYRCVFIKLEPNVVKNDSLPFESNSKFLIVPSPHPLFTQFTFQLDLSKSEEELLKIMHPKTRYNIKVAQKNNVIITEEKNPTAFNDYLNLLFETTKRQGFFAHNKTYHQLMWETLHPKGLAHLLTAKINIDGKSVVLVAWVLFLLNDILYYPYGASSDKMRNVMASNLMMWEAIRFGKRNGAKVFDLWGSLGPNPDPKDPWFGFHRFKQGYGAKLIEFEGSFDLVINPALYGIYNTIHNLRQIFLSIKGRRDK
ncbi:peptidoglycan bridge formation glycyltransferase FemA/FemB family protein [Candidatus Gottesmanbacteria bacterium]|nr:peptidoglycan bridge formation glycyltransferase FemA/FemB family protein [Candidatus Gottesmanbacteria bacterium]